MDLLLDRCGDGVGHDVGVRARIMSFHDNREWHRRQLRSGLSLWICTARLGRSQGSEWESCGRLFTFTAQ